MSQRTPLDDCWEQVNALGGTFSYDDQHAAGYDQALGHALAIIEKLGGRDLPRPRYIRTDENHSFEMP